MAAKHLSLRFWFGVLAVFLYACMRPRFGAGPRTAAIAGLTVFLSTGLVAIVTINDLGLLTGVKLWITVAWTMAETIVAALVGASLYRERP